MRGEPPQPGLAAGPTVIVEDERDYPDPNQPVDVSRWEALVADVLLNEGLDNRPAEIHLHFVDYHAELALLVVHGVLHLLGDDHSDPDQAMAMQSKERSHLARHGVERP